ncbi:O-antigen ligase family protein [Haematobacter massiliensis]|uniref:O-antigen ligase family protein n=1 Tax=Haematobacter massiliensis TaxID=195105 RepID=UPI0023F19131|nr:hypothetical protein [Haematobacter massiliensis]
MTARTADSQAIGAKKERAPWPIVVMLICVIMVPIEFSFRAAGLFLTTSKLCMIVMTFVILPKLPSLKMQSYDWLIVAHALWTATALILLYGTGSGIQSSGFYLLEFLVVYLVARIYLRTPGQIKATVNVLFIMVAVSAAFAIPEGLTGRPIVHEIARAMTGNYYPLNHETRMGIFRAKSFFEHEILYGVFVASTLALVWFTSTPEQRSWKAPLIGIATFFSASSAPLMIFTLQIWLLLLERFTRHIKNRLMVIGGVIGAFLLMVDTFTGRGVIGIITMLALNPSTAWNRRLIWEFGIDDVLRYPFFGFEPITYSRPNYLGASVDNYWLLIMMRSGIPALVFLFLGMLLIWLAIARLGNKNDLIVRLRNGWGMAILALLLTGATVAFFGKLQPLFSFFIGFGAALANCYRPEEETPTEKVAEPVRRGPVFSRFGPEAIGAIRQRPEQAAVSARAEVSNPRAETPLRRQPAAEPPPDRAKPPLSRSG